MSKIIYNSKIIDDKKLFKINTHTLHYGSNAFEGIRSYITPDKKINIFRLDDHIKRLIYSAKSLGIENLKYSKEELMEFCHKLIKVNNLKETYIRPNILLGQGIKVGFDKEKEVILTIETMLLNDYLVEKKLKVKIVNTKRIPSSSIDSNAKIGGHYINSINALNELKNTEFDDAILLDENEYIAETSVANLFFLDKTKKILHTPKITNILPGITRDSIITISKDLGYKVLQRDISQKELDTFKGVFTTGTATEIRFLKNIIDKNNKVFEYETSICEDIVKKFNEVLHGEDSKYLKWYSIK